MSMNDMEPTTRWDRILPHWWLIAALGLAGLVLLPNVLGGRSYEAQVKVEFPVKVEVTTLEISTTGYALEVIAEVRTDDVAKMIESDINATFDREFLIPKESEVLIAVAADSPEAAKAAADAFVDRLREGWRALVVREIDRLASEASIAVDTLSTRIAQLDEELQLIPNNDAVIGQIIAADRTVLESQRSIQEAAIEQLLRVPETIGEKVVVSERPEAKATSSLELRLLGLILGLLAGLAAAALWARLDRRVRSARDVTAACGHLTVVAPTGLEDLSAADIVAATAIASLPVTKGDASAVAIVQWQPLGEVAADIATRCDAAGVAYSLTPPLSTSVDALSAVIGHSVVLIVPLGTVNSRRLGEVTERLSLAGATQLTVLLTKKPTRRAGR